MNRVAIISILLLTLTACSTTKKSYWSELQNSGANSAYCKNNLKNSEDIDKCELDSLALEHARKECNKDSSPEYCLVMAKSGWEDFKLFVGVGGKITKQMAQEYPVMCGHKEKNIKFCTPQSGTKTLHY